MDHPESLIITCERGNIFDAIAHLEQIYGHPLELVGMKDGGLGIKLSGNDARLYLDAIVE